MTLRDAKGNAPQRTGLIVKDPTKGPYADPDVIWFDAALSVVHTRVAQVTSFPVEGPVNVSDNRRQEPARIAIEGLITNATSQKTGDEQALIYAQDAEVIDDEDLARSDFNDRVRQRREELGSPVFDFTRSRDIYARILGLWEGQELCGLTTPLEVYESGVLQSLMTSEGAASGDSIAFSAVWQEVFIAKSRVEALPEEPSPAPPKRPAAVQPAQPVTPATPEENESLFRQMVGPQFGAAP